MQACYKKNLKVSRDRSCISTESKETRNTEDSDIEIIDKSWIPRLRPMAYYYNLLKLCAKSIGVQTFYQCQNLKASVFLVSLLFVEVQDRIYYCMVYIYKQPKTLISGKAKKIT